MSEQELPFIFARNNQVAIDGDTLLVGPDATMNGLREARRVARRPLTPQILPEAEFHAALVRLFNVPVEQGDASDVAFDLEALDRPSATRDLLEDATEAPVIRLVNQLLRQAVQARASDLHMEPHEDGLRVRMRVDGTMQKILDRQDVPARRVVSRLKVMADLDIAETRLPQDGRMALRLGGRAIDVRLSSLPGHYGERVVMRLLDRTSGLMGLHQLGLQEADETKLHRLAALPNGIILATGPTGSGKTTTLYSLLRLANRAERNILTIEDPVEYDLPGVSQTQVNAEIGLTFAKGLRSILRQDPDVILVGEIRDPETAHVACEAALTGHLVFSSLHANNALSAVVRMRELGVDAYLISSTLRGVVAQRLLRRVCSTCRRAASLTEKAAALFTQAGLDVPRQLYEAAGCDRCQNTGFDGRTGAFDILEIDDTLRQAIDAGVSETQMRQLSGAPVSGLFAAGLRIAALGETTLDEVCRVIGETA